MADHAERSEALPDGQLPEASGVVLPATQIKKQAQLERDSCACWHCTSCPPLPRNHPEQIKVVGTGVAAGQIIQSAGDSPTRVQTNAGAITDTATPILSPTTPFKILLRHIGAHVTVNLTQTHRASCASELLSSGSFYERGRACIICSQERCRAETRREISVRKNENARGNGAGSPQVNRPRPLMPLSGAAIVG